MTEEIFVPVKGFEGLYEISNYGQVKSCAKYKATNYSVFCPEKIMKRRLNSLGYPMVVLKNSKYFRRCLVHRLVAIHFVPNPDNLPEVDHINSDKACTAFWNLQWVTRLQNEQKAWRIGEKARGERHQNSKPIYQMTMDGTPIRDFPNACFARDEFGYCPGVLSKAARGLIRQAYGYKWKYA